MSENHRFLESIDTFKVRFEGGNSIDAEIFTKTINNTIELIKASAHAIDPNAFLRLEIKATKEGSFETIIDAVAKYADDLINKDNVRLAVEIVGGYLSFLQIKSHLKGKKPKSIEQTQQGTVITNQDDQQITATKNIVKCYFNDSKIDNTIVQIFTDLKSTGREGITIEHQNKSESFKKTDYEKMSTVIVEQDKPITAKETLDIIKECTLIIRKPDLIANSKWDVIFAGQKISIKIEDEEFLKQWKDGIIKLSWGCKLVCDLNIKTEINNECDIIRSDYNVTKVHGIKDKEEQLSLFASRKEK